MGWFGDTVLGLQNGGLLGGFDAAFNRGESPFVQPTYLGLQKAQMENALQQLDLANSLERARAAGYPVGNSRGAQLGTALAPPQPSAPSGLPPLPQGMTDPTAYQRAAGLGAPDAGQGGGDLPPMAPNPASLPQTGNGGFGPQSIQDLIRSSWGPSASKGIPQLVTTLEKMVSGGMGLDAAGTTIPNAGYGPTVQQNEFNKQYGQTVAKNNENITAGPGARVLFGPTGLPGGQGGPGAGGLPSRPVGGVYENPNPANVTKVQTDVHTGKSLADKVGDIADASRTQAEAASDTMATTQRIRTAAKSANLGPGATLRQGIDRFANVAGIGGENSEQRLAATRTVMQGLADLTIKSRSELKGQGQITDKETGLLERARSGNIDDLSGPEIDVLMNVVDRLSQKHYANHERIMGVMRKDPDLQKLVPFYEVPPLPGAAAAPSPAGGGGQTAPRVIDYDAQGNRK